VTTAMSMPSPPIIEELSLGRKRHKETFPSRIDRPTCE
jgi:hypothetical protein